MRRSLIWLGGEGITFSKSEPQTAQEAGSGAATTGKANKSSPAGEAMDGMIREVLEAGISFK